MKKDAFANTPRPPLPYCWPSGFRPMPAGWRIWRRGGTGLSAMTPQAVTAQREIEARLRAAKTDEERKMVLADRNFYRVHLTFQGDEAEIVKKALGDQPAQMLLIICKAHLNPPASTV
jgi:hypothetical protein